VAVVVEQVREVLAKAPRLAGLQRSRWWLAGLRQAVASLSSYSLAGIWKFLRRWRLHYKRGRAYLHSPDLDYNTKLAYIAAAHQQARQRPDQVKVLYLDEFTYYRRPSPARAYAERGAHQALVRQGWSNNRQRRVVGTLDSQTGQVLVWQRRRLPVRVLLAFLRWVEAAYADATRIFIIMDNWPPHFHPTLLLALQNSKLVLLRLPTYAPWTNPIEKLWLRLNQEVLHHHPFEDDWQALQQSVQAWFDQWASPSDDLLRYVGLSPY
jgi:hypothetical protein